MQGPRGDVPARHWPPVPRTILASHPPRGYDGGMENASLAAESFQVSRDDLAIASDLLLQNGFDSSAALLRNFTHFLPAAAPVNLVLHDYRMDRAFDEYDQGSLLHRVPRQEFQLTMSFTILPLLPLPPAG